MDRRILIAVAVVVAVVAASALATACWDGPDDSEVPVGPDDPEVPESDDGLPDGFSFDETTNTLSADQPVDWHVFDMHHMFYDDDRTVYDGYSVGDARTLVLEPGEYTIEAGGERFTVSIGGTVHRDCDWIYDLGGVRYPVRIGFDIDLEEFYEATAESSEMNSRNRSDDLAGYLFRELPGLVDVGGTVRQIESALASEFVRIGGSVGDRQGYADFIAGFVQLCVTYPSSMPDHRGQYDMMVWGHSDYWCVPLETLYHMVGDCEDTSALVCAIYDAAGYDWAIGGYTGHVYAGVSIDGYVAPGDERVRYLGSFAKESFHTGIDGYAMERYGGGGTLVTVEPVEYTDTVYRSVETIFDQIPVGYLLPGNEQFDRDTYWGWSGFYTEDTKVVVPAV